MITIDGKQYRNLEEQVRKNQSDIFYLLNEAGVLNEFGIKVVGQEPSANLLPDPLTYEGEYGDAYAIGTEPPYTFYIYTREISGQVGNFWFNVGQFPMPSTVPGPQGPQGLQGPQGPKGALWYSGSTPPSPGSQYNTYDMYLNTASGAVYTLNSAGNWVQTGNIRGPQGIQGQQGPQGPQGLLGPVGPQGPQGNPGLPFSIVGTLAAAAQLPTPSKDIQNQAYLIGSAQPYDLYVIQGNDTDGYLWVNVGQVEGVTGPAGPEGPAGPAGMPGAPGEQGHPVYYINAALQGNPTIPMASVQPATPLIAVGDLVVGNDGYLARCYQINTPSTGQASMTTLYSLKGEPGASPTGITLTPNTATEGTLTAEQLSTLQANDFNYIVLNNEIYHLQDKLTTLVYTHVGRGTTSGEEDAWIKTIVISTLTRYWKLQVSGTQIYKHLITLRTGSGSPSPYNISFFLYSYEKTFQSGINLTLQDVWDHMKDYDRYLAFGACRINSKYYMDCVIYKSSSSITVLYYNTTSPNNSTSNSETAYNMNLSISGSVSVVDQVIKL